MHDCDSYYIHRLLLHQIMLGNDKPINNLSNNVHNHQEFIPHSKIESYNISSEGGISHF